MVIVGVHTGDVGQSSAPAGRRVNVSASAVTGYLSSTNLNQLAPVSLVSVQHAEKNKIKPVLNLLCCYRTVQLQSAIDFELRS